MRDLQAVLASEYGVEPSGWTLTEAIAISLDGNVIAGWGINPAGNRQGWIVTAPQIGIAFVACNDGDDNDGDGLIDFPLDPGCASATSLKEDPQCQDGVDNDADGKIDADGGMSAHHGAQVGPPDQDCSALSGDQELQVVAACGIGYEIALILPLLVRLSHKRRRSKV